MRVLCVDPSGVLGSLPSPVLYPEYGDSFLHVPGLDGAHAISVTEFLHGVHPDDNREVWLLWQSGLDRYDEIESHAASLLERMVEHTAVAVYGIQISWVTPGAETGQFFDHNPKIEELSWFADKGSQSTTDGRWRTLRLGLLPGDRSTDDELLIALALRAWLDREKLDCSLREPHYRALIHYAKSEESNSRSKMLNLLLGNWQKAYSQLKSRRDDLQKAPCKRKTYSNPTAVSKEDVFSTTPKGDQSPCCSFSRRLSIGHQEKCIGWFFEADDQETVKRWIDKDLYGKLKDTVGDAWETAKSKYHKGLRDLLGKPQQSFETNGPNPWEAVKEFESALHGIVSPPNDLASPDTLVEEIVDKQRLHTVQLFEATRCRPSGRMFMTTLALVTLTLLTVVFFREIPSASATTHQLPSEVWPLGLVMMVLLAAVWGIWRAQAPLRNGVAKAVMEFDSSREAARAQYTSYCDALDMAVRRVVASRNLEIAREEMAERDLELDQIYYHMERLAEYHRNYGGGDINTNHPDTSTANPIDPSLPEAECLVYWWGRAGTQVPIEGLPSLGTNQCIFANSRLAGIERIEIRAVAPVDRTVTSTA